MSEHDNSNKGSFGNNSAAISALLGNNRTKEVRFFSFQYYYLVACAIFIIFSAYVSAVYGFTSNAIMPEGTWFVLGGFSLWYPTVGLILPVFLYMFLYALFNARRIHIALNDAVPSGFTIHERFLYGRKARSEFKFDDIRSIRHRSGVLGFKYVYILLLALHMIYLGTDGFSLLTNPHTFGYGWNNAALYITSAAVDMVAILLIGIPGDNVLEVHTKDGKIHQLRYRTWMGAHDSRVVGGINDIVFGKWLSEKSQARFHSSLGELYKSNNAEKVVRSPPLLLLSSVLLITLAILSRVFYVFAGAPLRLIMGLAGVVYLFIGLEREWIKRPSEDPEDPKSSHYFNILSSEECLIVIDKRPLRTQWLCSISSRENSPAEQIEMENGPRRLKFMDYIIIPAMSLLVGWTLGIWFTLLPTNTESSGVLVNSIVGVIFAVIVLGLLVLLLIAPESYVKIGTNSDSVIYTLPWLSLRKNSANEIDIDKIKGKGFITRYAYSIYYLSKAIMKDRKSEPMLEKFFYIILYRLGGFLVFLLAGILLGALL